MSQLVIEKDKNLKALNTFRLPSVARQYVEPTTIDQVQAVFDLIQKQNLNYLVLGGGSNVLFKSSVFDGLIVHPALMGIDVEEFTEGFRVSASAGENWHNFVQFCLSQGIVGLENLSLIPGSVGACPVQNIGAYGVEVAEFIESVTCFDPQSNSVVQLTGEECRFGYRDSVFKRNKAHLVILKVNFVFKKDRPFSLDYSDLEHRVERELTQNEGKDKARIISDVICQIRSEKLPDPAKLGNAGSFFKNPIVTSDKFHSIKEKCPELVAFPYGDDYKLAAGWMIDFLGFKGASVGGASVHEKQALVLVNKTGDASSGDLFALVSLIQAKVSSVFGVELEIEPKVI